MTTPEELIKYIEQVKSGNKDAFTKVYEESYPYLHTCVIHIVKNEDTAQDMLQETYVEIFKNIGQLKSPADFLSWAATIANRKCFAYLKKDRDILVDEQTDDEGKETDFFESLADDEAFIPENIFDNKEKIKIIRDIIDSLSDVQRACVIGFYYNEQKQDEIAEELGIPVNTVKSHLNRAKAKIKDSVKDVEKKQDVKLYSIAPFMLLLFGHEAKEYAAKTAIPAMSGMTMAASAGAKAAGTAVKIKVLAAAIAGVAVIGGITGVALHHRSRPAPVVETVSEEVVAEPAVEPAATEVADAAEETISEEELQAALKEEYLVKIDACIGQEDYETAYSLIKEGNEKLGGSDFDEKLSEIPDAVRNNVKFENFSSVDSILWVIFIERKGDDWYLVSNPDLSYKDASARLEVESIEKQDTEDGNKTYTIRFRQTPVYTVSYPAKDDEPSWYYCLQDLIFFDYYTGQELKMIDTSLGSGENSKEGEKENVITWKGKEYPVTIYVRKDRSDENTTDLSTSSDMTETRFDSSIAFEYTVTCPKDYDGLCAYLTKTSTLPANAEENNKKLLFDATGKAVESDDGAETRYVFKDKNTFGIIATADTIYAMRVDDLATEAANKVPEAKAGEPKAAGSKQATAVTTQPVAAQSTAAVATTNTPPATTANANNAWLNIDPDCGYDGWADAYPTIDPDYDPTLYWTEEDWAIARSLRFE